MCELGNIYIYIYISISSNHKRCIEGGLINFNYKRNLAFRIILAFFPSLVANVLRHNHLVEPGEEGRKVTSHHTNQFFRLISTLMILCCNLSLGLVIKARVYKVTVQKGSLGVTSHVLGSAK